MRWLHAQRSKHDRLMALAQSHIERSQVLVRQGDPVKGWHHVTKAIEAVVTCGCDRSMWRSAVQAAIPDPTQETP